jgi:hypothetical protein
MPATKLFARTNEGEMFVIFEPSITPLMCGEFAEILGDSVTQEELFAVASGLAEEWARYVRIEATFPFACGARATRFWLN